MARVKKKPDETISPNIYQQEPNPKDVAVEALKAIGLDAFVKDGVVYTVKDNDDDYDKMQEAFKRIGYAASNGMIRRDQWEQGQKIKG